MECFTLASGVQATKKLNCCRLRCGGESKHGDVCLFPVTANLVGDQIFNISFTNFNLAGAERHSNRCHVLTGCGGMGFVDDDGETLTFQPCNAVDDVRKLLNRSSYNLCVSVQRNRKVSRIALIIHHPDQTRFVLHAHNGLLQLTVDHDTVGNDDDIIKDDLVIRIMQRCKPVGKPCDRVGFAGACTVLNQIILRCAVVTDITQQLANHIELMIPREYDILGLFRFSCQLVLAFLGFDKDELTDEVKDGILCQNILPHIGHAVLVFEGRIARTCIDSFTISHVERQEEGGVACELGGHINLL